MPNDLWYFYSGGERVIELITAIHSLRTIGKYQGRIGVTLDPTSSALLPKFPNDIEVQILPTTATTGQEHMSQRWRGLKLFNYDKVVVSDIDVVIAKDVKPIISAVSPKPNHLTTYAGYCLTPSHRFFLTPLFRTMDPDYIDPGTHIYIYMGLFGINYSYPHIDDMIDLCTKFNGKRCAAEEYAMAYVSQMNGFKIHWPRDHWWIAKSRHSDSQPIVWHCIRNRFLWAPQWRAAFAAARSANFMELGDPNVCERLCPGIFKIISPS